MNYQTTLEGAIFAWQHAYLGALKRLRTAALRWAHTIRRHYVSRNYSKLTGQVMRYRKKTRKKYRERFKMIITVGPQGAKDTVPSPPHSPVKFKGQSRTLNAGIIAH